MYRKRKCRDNLMLWLYFRIRPEAAAADGDNDNNPNGNEMQPLLNNNDDGNNQHQDLEHSGVYYDAINVR